MTQPDKSKTDKPSSDQGLPSGDEAQFAQQLASIHERIAEGRWKSGDFSQRKSEGISNQSAGRLEPRKDQKEQEKASLPVELDAVPESFADLLMMIEEVRQIDPKLLADDDSSVDHSISGLASNSIAADETARGIGDDTSLPIVDSEDLHPTAQSKSSSADSSHSAPTGEFLLGRFQIQELVGKGGFGLVYAAFDPQLQRRVAVKIPKPEAMLSQMLRKRFIREGRAAACLSHPNIVAVHEVGQQGPICYMATELIAGQNLSEWTKNREFSSSSIARIMVRVAGAIQHAHSRGILHRDLKPANILMEQENPKVTDFGLAQRIEPDAVAGELSADTRILGTPAYMSPEQASGGRAQVDIRTDVYGLGAVLYFLLAHEPPFSGASPLDIIEAVRSCEPRLPAKLNPQVPLDLQSICLKCLEKSPSKRYESAFDLQVDLQHFLDGHPVSARPITRIEQAVRWGRRNPVLAWLMASTAAAVLVAVLVSSVAWYSTSQALKREQAARAESEKAYAETKQAYAESEQAYQDAKKSVDKYFVSVSQNQLLAAPGLKTLRQELLQNAVAYYSGFIEKHQEDESLAHDLMRAFIHRATIDDELGDYAAAREGFETAIELLDGLRQVSENDLELRQQYGMVLRKLSRLDTIAGDTTTALSRIEQAIGIHQDLVAANFEPATNHGELGMLLNNRANILIRSGQPALAMDLHRDSQVHFQAAAELQPDNPKWLHQVATAKASQATVRLGMGDSQASELLLMEAVQTLRQLIDDYPDQLGYSMDLGKALANLGLSQGNLGRPTDQLESFQEATHVFDRLATIHPQVVLYQSLRASTRRAAALVLNNLSRIPECAEVAKEANEILQDVVSKAPENRGIQQELVLTQVLLGRVWRTLGEPDEARKYLSSAIESLSQGFANNPGDLYAGQNLAEAYQQMAMITDDTVEATGYLKQAQSVVDMLLEKWPGNPGLIGIQGVIQDSRQLVTQKESDEAE